ncbi:(p)ppGpp synthetase [Capsulimonas corticalis]|uniref:(P)ppGpp synthetase n=1 Tax=Capsulimonas corticalis TaxID=2219043 RepID=A0A402D6T9_9BACT|nr:bifunctional (p)ppGpp synthetase/guanosine-3',5'-bis(diphosphate) 3'-pyrophosphohydrolase [Capsulimonas corticalis]BDI31797.1 (p)ppGpp synthetase [Capsulimonas corticalis]
MMADDYEPLYQALIDCARSYHPDADTDLIRRAFDYAAAKHDGQFRRSGEPYIIHPIAVSTILAELEMDDATIASGLLHDVIEDCGVTRDQLAHEFGPEIADLVDGVTKLKLADFESRMEGDASKADAPQLPPPSPDPESPETAARKKRHGETNKSAGNLRKILLAMAKDLRVMVIKLADRLHNMRTLSAMPEHRQVKVAQETLQIFGPLAHRLGIWQIKWQLEDLAFKYSNPTAYNEIKQKLDRTRAQREQEIGGATDMLRKRLAEENIQAEIQGRPKHLYSIYNKMQKQDIDLDEVYDLIALRVIVNSVSECYHALGVVHDLWMPVPGRFDDYIAKAKSNGYQSLHTKVLGPTGEPLEIQIRTVEMHRLADFGIAAHWQYKEGRAKTSGDRGFEKKMSLLRQQLFDWQSDAKEPGEFLRSVVSDLFTDQVFVFTPKGDVLDFPRGATPVDAAYRIHSDLGLHCVGAKVNGKIVPLTYQFNNGDIVEILARPNASPSLDWLASAKTSHARTKIKAYFRKLRFTANVARGRELMQKELDRLHLDSKHLLSADILTKVATAMAMHSQEELLAAIGYGDVAVGTMLTRLRALTQETTHTAPTYERKGGNNGKLQVGGDLEDVAITRAKCCQPVPGDEVTGYMTRGKGVALHRHGCPNVTHYQQTEPERLLEVDWKPSDNTQRYLTDIKVELADRIGLLEDVGKLFSEAKTNIQAIRTRSLPNHTAVMQISFDAADTAHIAAVMVRLQRLTDVMDIHRLGVNEEPVE